MSGSVKTIHLATDHAGFAHKEEVKTWLKEQGYSVIDHGANEYNEEDDFTDFISLAAEAVNALPEEDRGIIFGGSGQGEGMLANSYSKIRAAVYYGGDAEIVRLSRTHNDSNVLSIGARFLSIEETKSAISLWLETEPLADEKYHRRNQKIEDITNKIYSK